MNFNIDKEKFMNKKKLFLLSEILYLIKEEYEYISHVQINVYNQFFRECFVIYKKIISADNCNIKNEYKTELNDFIDNFNNAKAHLNGNNKEISLDDIKSFDESRCKQELNGKQAVEAPDRGEAQGVNEDEGNTGPKGEARAVVLEESSLEQVPGSRDGIDGPVVRMRDSGSDVFKEHTDENISNPVGTNVGTSLGFFVPLITIYKVRKRFLINIIISC
ncbi:hypothetical protein PVBG_05854 [Plasmodium vivax Brazil I]|uniref:Uncharacterized protein n=1 Tax=Plasmodium vivax (strain Brazil I) TaxID=1033975 RepID=A0A0J9T2E3_PLAV1|nr:hypothetical protein PVBG_05854 [Plasmodium vivax Brazil I]